MAKFSDFISEYKTAQEPSKQEKARNWDIAIGLQQVDGLTPSRYLYQVTRDNIEGKLSHDEVHQSLRQYYRPQRVTNWVLNTGRSTPFPTVLQNC